MILVHDDYLNPVPALYDTPVPVSMAKMIMSRHVRRFFVLIVFLKQV